MSIAELEQAVALREAEGRDRMVIVVKREHEPRGQRVRVLPGVSGMLVGFVDGRIVVDVAVCHLRRYLTALVKA